MGMLDHVRRALRRSQGLPLVRGLLARRYERAFADNRQRNLFRGVFKDYATAQASAPATAPLGYDNPDSAALYRNRIDRVFPCDYPVLLWLSRHLGPDCSRVVDFGGHVGVSYYAYRRYLDYPGNLRWTVYELPAIIAAGRVLARELDREGQLSFSDDFAVAEGADLLLASGSLQYLDRPFADLLGRLQQPPARLLINLLPLHPSLDYYTLQSIGTAFCPYRISADAGFVASLEAIGYRLTDRWLNPERGCPIPFHPDHSLDGYHGLLFERQTVSARMLS